MKKLIFVTVTYRTKKKTVGFWSFTNLIPKEEIDLIAKSIGCLNGQTYSYSGRTF